MRAYQFIVEYKREPTARSFGDKIISRVRTSAGHDLGDYLHTAKTIIQLAYDPQSFSHWGIGHKKMQFGNQWLSVGVDNAKEVLQQIKPEIINLVLQELEESDPTPNNVFVPWLAREWSNGNIKRFEDIDSRLRPLMQDFIAYKNKRDFPPEAKDIMRLSAPQFEYTMTTYQPPAEQLRARGEAKTVYDDAAVRVIIPEDQEAACYYGQGTKWCTASTRGHNMFDHYNRQGRMYILLPKKPEYEGEKYQLHFYTEQFMNEQDEPVSLSYILKSRFPELLPFFIANEPVIENFVEFAPDELLEGLGQILGDIISEQAWNIVQDMEDNDDYFREWKAKEAIERGYYTEEDDEKIVDWDRVHEDDELNKYTEYNDKAGQFIRDIQSIRNLSGRQIKSYASDSDNGDEEGTPAINDLEGLYSWIVEEEVGENGHSISDFLRRRVTVLPSEKYSEKYEGSKQGEFGGWTVSKTRSR